MAETTAIRETPDRCTRCHQPLGAEGRNGICGACLSASAQTLEFAHSALPGTPAPQPSPRSPTRYERLELLGRGGMGEVYRARQTDLDRIVALKLVLSERSDDPMFVARFRREAVAMARLNHPHIVAIHDFGDFEGQPYLAMEFVTGASLRARLRHGALPYTEAFELATQICEAIAYAHELGIIHRDLKPENVLVTDDHQVKVADFGLAKLVGQPLPIDLTAEGMILGTLRYMAPEQLAGSRDVDQRADVYSLGVLLYEMFTGRMPIGRFAPPSRLAAVPRQLDTVLLQALDADPEHRFASARELATALAAVRQSETLSGEPGPSEAQSVQVLGNLPPVTSSLLGRDDERQLLRARLQVHRLVTLTGPGGTGKSRLALQLGYDCGQEFHDGVWFVPLAELSDPRRVAGTIAAALGVREDARDIGESLREHLKSRDLLLILDNFEQIIAASSLVANLLTQAPRLRVVVTSRVALHVTGESEFSVGPLAIPRLDASHGSPSLALTSPAVALFAERARAVQPDFQLNAQNLPHVIEICRRLDGLPLAIELAAARIKLLAPESIAARLTNSLKLLTGGARDLPARQQTMRAAIAWSFELLSPPQRTLLAWLSLPRGSFTVESVERLVSKLTARSDVSLPSQGGPLDEFDVLDALLALLEHNLLRRTTSDPVPRFAMYETIREFGRELLGESSNLHGAFHAHAEWCLETVRQGEPKLTGSDPAPILTAWHEELPDFRAALAWWCGAGDRPNDALRIIGELWYYWVLRGTANDGIDEVAAVVKHPRVTPDSPELSRAFHALGTLYFLRDRPQEAQTVLERALDIRRRFETEAKALATLGNLASVKRSLGDLVGARRDLEEVLAFRRREGDPRGVAIVLSNLSLVCQFMGRLEDSQAILAESLAIYQRLDDRRGVARQMLNLGRLEHMRGRFEAALSAFDSATEGAVAIGDLGSILNAKLATANTLTGLERFSEARALFDECAAMMPEDDSPSRRASLYIARGYLNLRTSNNDEALTDFRQAFQLRVAHRDLYGAGESLLLIAHVFAQQKRLVDAARLLGAESKLREQIKYVHSNDTQQELEQTRKVLEDALGVEVTRAAELEGRQLSLDQVADLVIASEGSKR